MTVGELREKLDGLDDDIIVVAYSSIDEGYDKIYDVSIMTKQNRDNWKYTKSDHPLDDKYGWVDADKIVVIG